MTKGLGIIFKFWENKCYFSNTTSPAMGGPLGRGSPSSVSHNLNTKYYTYHVIHHLLSLSKSRPRSLHVTGRNLLVDWDDGLSMRCCTAQGVKWVSWWWHGHDVVPAWAWSCSAKGCCFMWPCSVISCSVIMSFKKDWSLSLKAKGFLLLMHCGVFVSWWPFTDWTNNSFYFMKVSWRLGLVILSTAIM